MIFLQGGDKEREQDQGFMHFEFAVIKADWKEFIE